MAPKLYIVVPCYNEEDVLAETTKRLTEKLNVLVGENKVSEDSRILYVDDGSKDGTWSFIASNFNTNKYVTGIHLSRNRGHQNALLAGLMYAKDHCDCAISMDCDLQDDIDAIDQFLVEYAGGAEIVYGVRSSRKKDSFFKRATAVLFYKLMLKMGVDVIYNHADYRLMSKRALNELASFNEVNLFLRGIIPMLGFKTAKVPYERGKRFAGKSKYPVRKMLSFAADGITSCSVRPIRLIITMGFFISFLSLLGLIYIIYATLFGGDTVQGWSSLVVLITFFGGFEILSIGIVGEYVGKIYMETKNRPRFIIEEELMK